VLLGSLASSAAAETCPNEAVRAESRSVHLPDCRVYELVSPAEKDGNQAAVNNAGVPVPAIANAVGTAIAYEASGPLVDAPSGEPWFVSRRSTAGWHTSAVLPRLKEQVLGLFNHVSILSKVDPSPDLSHFMFNSFAAFAVPPDAFGAANIFLAGEDPYAEPTWLGRPTVENPDPPLDLHTKLGDDNELAGGSPDFSTVYFGYAGTLVSEDEPRRSNPAFVRQMEEFVKEPGFKPRNIWGFYEWRRGVLSAAGVLPSGQVDPWGAVPAAIGQDGALLDPDNIDNEVSIDGSRAFFVSPDPAAEMLCREAGYETEYPGGCVPQLYVREDGERTQLVSRDVLTSEVGEPPAPSPHGPLAVETVPPVHGVPADSLSYVFASPDGSQAFFESSDRLARSADGTEPAGPGPWTYDFSTGTGTLTYLPGVVGPILASASNGSRFLFDNTATNALELWSSGAGGPSVTTVARLPKPEHAENAEGEGNENGELFIAPARATRNGSVLVFETDSPLPGGFNNGGGWEQVYRYDVNAGALSCVSCPPAGLAPTGDAHLSGSDRQPYRHSASGEGFLPNTRGISAEGGRVFFDSRDPLVPQDVNGQRDVYEWENGHVQLISAGTGPESSFFLDNGESGEDVFFATADSLASADADGAYDVYDARMGVASRPAPPICTGTGCQGVAQTPPSFATPPSVTFSGVGNLEPVPSRPGVKSGPSTRALLLARALRVCRARPRPGRARCDAQARRRYGPRRARKAAGRGGRRG